MSESEHLKSKVIDRLVIGAKVGITLAALWGIHELSIHLAEPIARFTAIHTLRFSGEVEDTNPNYFSMHDQIVSAVQATEAKGIDVYYQKYMLDLTAEEIAKTGYLVTKHEFGNIIRTQELNGEYFKYMSEEVIVDQLSTESPEFVSTILRYASDSENFYDMTKIPGSGFNRRNTPKADIQGLVDYINREVAKNNGNQIPLWKTLEYWLDKEQDDGNLSEALIDNSIALKALARSTVDGKNIYENQYLENVIFMSNHILDQSSLLGTYHDTYIKYGYYNIDPNHSAVDMIGAPYREYTKVALLDRFPAAVVVAMVEAQEWSQYDREGSVKIASSLSSAMGLYELEEYLQSFEK